jgi:DNA-binding CsgD family transcriptional regulator
MRIIGRECELAALRAVAARQLRAQPHVIVHGDPGVGKSVLLRAAVEHAEAAGVRVLTATGHETETDVPYAGLHQIFMPVLGHLDLLEPFHRDALRRVLGLADGPRPQRLVVSAASLALLLAAARDGSALLAVEDVHWLDASTRDVLLFVLLRLRPGQGLSVIFTRRSVAANDELPACLNLLELGPLAEQDALELLRERYPDLPERAVLRVMREAAGNPLALTELPAVLAAEPEPQRYDALPRTRLEAVFSERILSLPPQTRAALLLIALDGGLSDRGGQRTTALSGKDIAAIERLELITGDSTPMAVRFRHPLVRSAIIGMATPDELRGARATLAQSYLEPSERMLWDLRAEGVHRDERAAAELERISMVIDSRGATRLAVSGLQQAAALSPAPRAAALRLYEAADLAAECGDPQLSVRLLDEAQGYGDAGSVRAQITRAYLLLNHGGDLATVWRMLSRLVERCDGAEERESILRLMIVTAYYRQDAGDWWDIAELVKRYSDQIGPDVRLLFDALGAVARGGSVPRDQLLRTLDELPESVPSRRIADLCLIAFRVDALIDAGHHLRALAERECGQGAVIPAATGYLLTAYRQYFAGEWDRAQEIALHGLELAGRHELEPAVADFHCLLGLIAASRGDTGTARELSRVVERWAALHDSGLHLEMSARNLTLAALADGDYETAYVQATRLTPAGRVPAFAATAPWAVYDLVEAAIRTDRRDEAAAHLAAAERAGLAGVSPRLRVQSLAARALVEPDDAAVSMLQDALALPSVHQWPFHTARIELALGEVCRRTHRTADARLHLRRAVDMFVQLRADPWTRRAEAELRAAGVAVTGMAFQQRPARAAEPDLTAQEMKIAQLAASGLSNKEIGTRMFLSPRTVGSHLYHIFPKLGISSRSALRDALAALGEPADDLADDTDLPVIASAG